MSLDEFWAAWRAEEASMAENGRDGPAAGSTPDGGFGVRESHTAKPSISAGRITTALAALVADLAARSASGDREAERRLHRLHTTLRNQARIAKRALPKVESQRDASELGIGAARMFGGLTQRAAKGDLQALAELHRLRGLLRTESADAAQLLNGAHDYSWRQIGEACGISAMSAYDAWGHRHGPA